MAAVLAESRVSPLDGGNMNRAFPGGADAGPTRGVAGFVAAHLLPGADLVLDVHSGGTGLDFLDSACLTLTGARPPHPRAGAELCAAVDDGGPRRAYRRRSGRRRPRGRLRDAVLRAGQRQPDAACQEQDRPAVRLIQVKDAAGGGDLDLVALGQPVVQPD